MGIELYGLDPGPPNGSAQTAQNDAHYTEYVYSGTTGALSAGMPVYQNVLDAAEYNSGYSPTALSPATPATGGKVTVGTDAAATNLVCVGIYQPESNFAATPSTGTVIRVLDRGVGLGLASAKTGGTSVKVGDILIADATPGTALLSNGNTFVAGRTIAQALATGTLVASAGVIIAPPGSGATTQLINVRVRLI